MRLNFGSGGDGKQSPVLIVVLIVAILAAGGMFARNFIGGDGGSDSVEVAAPVADSNAVTPAPTTPEQNVTASAPVPPPAADTAAVPSAALAPAGKDEMKSIKVFGRVNVNYPANWRINPSAANTAAVFSDGKASFEIHAPDPKADSAIAIAQSALKTHASGGKVTSQGKDSIAGNEAYWYAVNRGGRTIRIVGIDAPTRIVLVEQVNSGQFSAYREIFNKMQSGISF